MKFWKRLRAYLIGVGLGCVLVVLFFKERVNVLTSWTPENTVLRKATQAHLVENETFSCMLNCLELTVEDFREKLQDDAEVDFGESSTRKDPKVYRIIHEGTQNWNNVEAKFINDSTVTFINLNTQKSCDC